MFNASHFRPAQTATALGPLRAWEYLRLRREAACLTIDQLVSRLTRNERRAEQALQLGLGPPVHAL